MKMHYVHAYAKRCLITFEVWQPLNVASSSTLFLLSVNRRHRKNITTNKHIFIGVECINRLENVNRLKYQKNQLWMESKRIRSINKRGSSLGYNICVDLVVTVKAITWKNTMPLSIWDSRHGTAGQTHTQAEQSSKFKNKNRNQINKTTKPKTNALGPPREKKRDRQRQKQRKNRDFFTFAVCIVCVCFCCLLKRLWCVLCVVKELDITNIGALVPAFQLIMAKWCSS